MKYSRAVQQSGKKMDMALLIAVIAACLIGLCAIFSATRYYESNTNVIVQGGAFCIGLALCILLSKFDYEQYGLWTKYIYGFCVAILVLVLFIGKSGDWGAQSWIRIGPIGIQPSEIAKVGFILTFSWHLTRVEQTLNKPLTLLGLLAHIGVLAGLIMLQPDAGMRRHRRDHPGTLFKHLRAGRARKALHGGSGRRFFKEDQKGRSDDCRREFWLRFVP